MTIKCLNKTKLIFYSTITFFLLITTNALHAEQESAIFVSSTHLFEEYEANELAADRKYKGKKIVVTGKISDFDRALFTNDPIVLLDGNWFAGGVQCLFPKSAEEALFNLSKGEKIMVKGVGGGKVMTFVLIKNAVLQGE